MGIQVIINQFNIQHQTHLMGNSKELIIAKKTHLTVIILQGNLMTKTKEDQILNLPGQEKIQLIEGYLEREAEAKDLEGKDLHNNHLADMK